MAPLSRINAGSHDGRSYGIYAKNYGTGALSITTTGTTTGATDGISATNSRGTDLTINAAETEGGENGIRAKHFGTGALSITTTGTTTGGTTKDGIYAYKFEGTDLTINVTELGAVIGGLHGIKAENIGYSTGALSITTTGETTGTDGDGIYAKNSGTDLTINAATTRGGRNGIYARNSGTGALSITTTGTTTGYGTNLPFVNVQLPAGIYAKSEGGGAVNITTSGAVTGGLHGINVQSRTNDGNNGKTSITVTSTSTITTSAVGGHGILNRMEKNSGNAFCTFVEIRCFQRYHCRWHHKNYR